jgi:hypothetical protein
VPTDFKWETPNYFGVDARGIARSQYFCPTAKLGTGSFYFGTFHDHAGKPLVLGSPAARPNTRRVIGRPSRS